MYQSIHVQCSATIIVLHFTSLSSLDQPTACASPSDHDRIRVQELDSTLPNQSQKQYQNHKRKAEFSILELTEMSWEMSEKHLRGKATKDGRKLNGA